MKSEKLMDALGEIDESYYLPVLPDPLPRKKHPWPLALAAAAMVCLCLFGLHQLEPVQQPEPAPEISTTPAEPVEKPAEQPMEPTLEQILHRLYEEAPILQSLTLAQWTEECEPFLPENAALTDDLTWEQLLPVLEYWAARANRSNYQDALPPDLEVLVTWNQLNSFFELQKEQQPIFSQSGYEDLDPESPAFEAIMFLTDKRYLPGTRETTFSPDEPLEREALVYALRRTAVYKGLSGELEAWLQEQELPENLTMAQLVNLLYDFTGEVLGWEVELPEEVAQPDLWVEMEDQQAYWWAQYHGMIPAQWSGELDVPVTRAEFAQVLYSLLQEKSYRKLPDGQMVPVLGVQDAEQQEELEALARRIVEAYLCESRNAGAEDLTALTIRACDLEALRERYGQAIDCALENQTFVQEKTQAWKTYRQHHGTEAELTMGYDIAKPERYKAFAWVPVTANLQFRYAGEEQDSFSEEAFLLTFLETEDGWRLLTMQEIYEPLDWIYEHEGLEAAREQMRKMTE